MMTSKSVTPILNRPLKTKVATGIMKPTMIANRLREMWVLYSNYYNVDQRDFIEKLEDNLKVKIYPTERMKYKEVKDNYRRSDLEKLLKDDVELFERKLP